MAPLSLETSPPPSVLLVDDNPANLIALAAVLKPLGARLVEAASGPEALARVEKEEFAVALLDVQMPEMDGFEVATRMREMDTGRELPIIFLTAIHRDDGFAKRGYAAGAADYITKPFDAEIVRARVKAFVDLFEQRESVRRAQVAIRTSERDEALRKLVAFEQIAAAGLSAGDVDAFLAEILSVFVNAADTADAAAVLLKEGDALVLAKAIGLGEEIDERVVVAMGEGFAGTIASSRQPVELENASTSSLVKSTWLKARGTKALYGVPLVVDGELFGVAHIGSRRVHSFAEHDKRLFAAVAERAAWAIAQQQRRARQLELERRARIDAEIASRAKDEFLAIVSHELRTPLNAVLGWTVAARAKAPPEIDRHLAIVERNARAQARIVEDILDVARIASGNLRLEVSQVELDAIVDAAVEALRHAAEAKGIRFERHLERVSMQADAGRMQQVAWNLVSNAIKFSERGGTVVLRLSRGDDTVTLSVRDEGEGIEPDFLPHVFEAFRQQDASTTRRHGGIGLGLSIVKQLVIAHGGTIRAESEGTGKGAHMIVELPLVASVRAEATSGSPMSASHPPPGDDEPLRLDGKKILVVDDEDDARLLVMDVLRDRGAVVAEASSAHGAFEELVRFRPDLIVSDIAMPGGDGYGFMRAVRALPPERGGNTPAVAVTAHARTQEGERAITAGFQTYLAKPIDFERLVNTAHALTTQEER